MRYTAAFAMALATCAAASVLPAQQRISVDLRGAAAAPTNKLADAELSTGIGVGGTLAYRVQSHLHVYGGWDWMHFSADHSFAGDNVDLDETGYTAGLRFEHPLRDESSTAFRVEAGLTYKHVEIENADGDRVVDSGHGGGFEVGTGVLLPLPASWRLATMLRYRSLSPDFAGAGTVRGDLNYVALEVGITRRY